jgi:hypothetical protein
MPLRCTKLAGDPLNGADANAHLARNFPDAPGLKESNDRAFFAGLDRPAAKLNSFGLGPCEPGIDSLADH